MAKKKPTKSETYWEGLTTLRAGCLEHQPDAARDEMFSDPTPYFSLKAQFGLDRSEYEQFEAGRKITFLPVSEGPSRSAGNRSRGIPGVPDRDAFHHENSPMSRRDKTGRSKRRRA
jgi:hypothetical protein